MLTYEQRQGRLYANDFLLGSGYSGNADGKNNPQRQAEHDVGPIPTGAYLIGDPHDSPEHGPFVLPLTPLHEAAALGRSGFLIHGDSIEHPGEASKGCIIMPRPTRERIAQLGANPADRLLVVVSGNF